MIMQKSRSSPAGVLHHDPKSKDSLAKASQEQRYTSGFGPKNSNSIVPASSVDQIIKKTK